MTLVYEISSMSGEFELHLGDLSAEADSALQEAHDLLLDFSPTNNANTPTSQAYSASEDDESPPTTTNDVDSDVEEIVQEIPVVNLLDSTIDLGPQLVGATNTHDSQDDDIIFVQETVNAHPITIDLCSDSYVGPAHSTPNPRRRPFSTLGSVTLDDPFTVDENPPPRRRRLENPSELPPPLEVALESTPAARPSNQKPDLSFLDASQLSQNSSLPLKCPICLENCVRKQPSSTICGHVFCKACIEQCIRQTKQCPMCKKRLNVKNVHRLYLN